MPEAGCLSMRIKDNPAEAVGIVNVHGTAEVSVAVRIVPVVITKVAVAPTVFNAVTDSTYPAIVGLLANAPALPV